MYRVLWIAICAWAFVGAGLSSAQEINEYTIKRVVSPPVIDGRLTEPEWAEAPYTGNFVIYTDGSAAVFPTRAKMLWDDTYLYIAYICEDPDVWATYTARDAHLWEEDVVEMFIDPDGDGLNYLELQVNPLGTLMDLLMNKAYSAGGTGDFTWNLEGFTAGIGVDGTLNDKSDTDSQWVCEVALPFRGMAFTAPGMNFPPVDGDTWRLNLYRYEYIRTEGAKPELTAWNQTDKRGYHAPDKFGRVLFSHENVLTPSSVNGEEALPGAFGITGNFPNPFNPSSSVEFVIPSEDDIKLEIYTVLGQRIRTLVTGFYSPGLYSVVWDGMTDAGEQASTGVYVARLQMNDRVSAHCMLMVR